MPALRVGMAQIRVEGGRPDANLARAEAAVAAAAAAGCDIVVLPECLDFGWGHPSARAGAGAVPGPVSERLGAAAASAGIHVVAGIVEREGDDLYNTALVLGADGALLGRHRKVNEIPEVRALYRTGDGATVVETPIGRLGVAVCADLLRDSIGLGHRLCALGAELIVSPSSWVVDVDRDAAAAPYGAEWLGPYRELARTHGVPVVGVSNVGPVTGGAWAGRIAIGTSLAVAGDGSVAATGPYGVDAEALLVVPLVSRTRSSPRRASSAALP